MSFRRSFLFILVGKSKLMKKLFPVLILISVISCKKSSGANISKIDSTKIIDSINLARTKINDSILSHDRFKDWEGTHALTHDMISGKGNLSFKKIGRDEYKISGENKSGSNFVKIEGTGEMRSDKHLSFEGTIKQSISDNDNGKIDTRSGRKTFLSKDGGKTFRLQQSINSSGFSDQIIIKF